MHVVITGASAGIGRALAKEYAAQGAQLTLVARRRSLLEELAKEVGGEHHLIAQDLADPDAAPGVLTSAEAALGPVDVLVNNAGMQVVDRVERIDPKEAERVLTLNLHTPLRLCMAAIPGMRERRRGALVNVCSAASYAALKGMVHYAASKAGLAAASELMRVELKGSGVHVVTVYPGYIKTDMGDAGYEHYRLSAVHKVYRPGDAGELARRVRTAVSSKKARVVYPLVNWLPISFEGTTRMVLEHIGPPLKH